MGRALAQAAHEAGLAGYLSHSARLALDYMCWHSRDLPSATEPAATYWAGHLPIAVWLLGEKGREGDEISAAGMKAVQRAVKDLRTRGLITQTVRAGHNRNAVYRIEVGERWAPPVDNSGQDTLVQPGLGGHQCLP